MGKKLTIIHTDTDIELYFTLYPFLLGNSNPGRVEFVHLNSTKYDSVSGETVLFTRIFKDQFDDSNFVEKTLLKLRKSFNKIYFLDDSSGADSTHFEFIESLDGYFKTKLPDSKDIYRKKMYGRQVFSEYYHREFDVNDDEVSYREPIDDFQQASKLATAFNLGYGLYPKPESRSFLRFIGRRLARANKYHFMRPYFKYRHKKLIRELSKPVQFDSRIPKVSARFRYQEYPNSIGYQRYLFEKKVTDHDHFLTGVIPREEYLAELNNVLVTLSPFGYGEVCFRDFESIIVGSLLLKPDMSHVVSTPDIYIPGETYIPVKWDGSDLIDKVDDILSDPIPYFKIIENARAVYREALVNIEKKFDEVFGELLN